MKLSSSSTICPNPQFAEIKTLDMQSIVQCFSFLTNPAASAETIKYANEYLNHCESIPNFSSALLQIADQQTDQIQLQSILLFSNVIKRHWSKRGRSGLVQFQKEKEHIKDRILKLYLSHAQTNGKHLNQIIKYISRFQYPTNYPALHTMLVELLKFVYSTPKYTQSAAMKKPVILLSTAKGVMKEFSLRKIHHQAELFEKLWEIAELSRTGRDVLESQIKERMQADGTPQNIKILGSLIEMLKKSDKITCYVIESAPSSQQCHPLFPPVILQILTTLSMFISALPTTNHPLYQPMESYISYILQRLSKIQTTYPLMFTQILKDYLTGIIGMLHMAAAGRFKGDRMLGSIVQAATRPFNTFPYYMSPQEFGESIYFKKAATSPQDLALMQSHCYQQFLAIFSPPLSFLQFLMTTLLPSPSFFSISPQDEYVLEQINEQSISDGITEQTPYELAIILCKSVMRCFKSAVKEALPQICRAVLNKLLTGCGESAITNIIELIIIFPKIYEEEEMPMQLILDIITKLYSKKMELLLARMIKAYQQFFNDQQSIDAFNMICSMIASNNLPPSITYQCCLTLRKILSNTLSVNLILPPNVLSSLTSLLNNAEFAATPTMLWPTINLINQIIKAGDSSNKDAIDEVVHGIQKLIQNQNLEEVVTAALSDLLINLIITGCSYFRKSYMGEKWPNNFDPLCNLEESKVSYTILPFLAAIPFLLINLPRQTECPQALPRLLLSVVTHYPTLQQQKALNLNLTDANAQIALLIERYGTFLLTQVPQIGICIIEQSIIAGVINVNLTMIEGIFNTVLSNVAQNQQQKIIRLLIPLSSLYLTGCIATTQYSPNIFKLLMTKLLNLYLHVTPLINGLRSLILIVFNYHILKFPPTQMYAILDSLDPAGRVYWIGKYFWSFVFSINKLVNKLNAAAVMHCITQIGIQDYAKIIIINHQGSLPIDNLLKTLHIQLQPMKSGPLMTSYNHIFSLVAEGSTSQPYSRKLKLHLTEFYQILVLDIRPAYVQTVGNLLRVLDWDESDLKERVDTKCAQQIWQLLQGHWKQQYKIE